MSTMDCRLQALAATAALLVAGCANRNIPTSPIEKKYFADGPWAVTFKPAGECCDSKGNSFDLYYPSTLGANGFKHPILTWANGSFGSPTNVDYLLRHFASWGFFVVATEDPMTGVGQTVMDAATHMVNLSRQSSGTYAGKLDESRIGAVGHSQGAGGAINAQILASTSTTPISTVIAIELPAQVWCSSGTNCADTSKLTSGSIFLVNGSSDFVISPALSVSGASGLQSIAAYYDAIPAGLPKLKGTLIGPNHNDVQGHPDCSNVLIGCVNGVYGYLGYPTAWLMDRLQSDTYAHQAFVHSTGEMFFQAKNWMLVASNIQ